MHPLVAQLLLPLLGLVGPALVLLGLPGTWLLLALAGLAEWTTPAQLFSGMTVAVVLILAVLGEAWEFFAGSAGAKRAGAGRRGALGALGGGLVGAVLGTFLIPAPVIGTLLGGGLGAFAGAAGLERRGGRDLRESLRIGRAAGVGHALGLAGKLAASVLVWAWVSVSVCV
jgi:uncharacterized protein YqgC (DUF456 family)